MRRNSRTGKERQDDARLAFFREIRLNQRVSEVKTTRHLFAIPWTELPQSGAGKRTKHFKSIRAREAATTHFPAVPTSSWDTRAPVADSRLVSASVVVSLEDKFALCGRVLEKLRAHEDVPPIDYKLI